jgi:hypothetical protein
MGTLLLGDEIPRPHRRWKFSLYNNRPTVNGVDSVFFIKKLLILNGANGNILLKK